MDQHNNNAALKVLADAASDEELLNRYGDAKHGSRSSSGNTDPSSDDSSSSSGAKGGDESGRRGSYGNHSSGKKALLADKGKKKEKKDGLRKGKWMVSRIVCVHVFSCPSPLAL